MEDYKDKIDKKIEERQKILNAIKQVESSGGIDTDHKEMTSGIHAGESAIGSYGLMPNTIRELANRYNLQDYKNQPDQTIQQAILPGSEEEQRMAATLLAHIMSKPGTTTEKAAYKWNMGHNIPPQNINNQELKNSPYVKKFDRVLKKLNKTDSST